MPIIFKYLDLISTAETHFVRGEETKRECPCRAHFLLALGAYLLIVVDNSLSFSGNCLTFSK